MPKARQQIDAVLKHLYKWKDIARSLHIDSITENKELLKICGNKIEIERILGKLKEDGYIVINLRYPLGPDGKNDMKKGLFNYCGITFEGRLFWENGGYTSDLRKKKIVEFPKNYWWLIAIFSFIIGFFADVIKERVRQKILLNTIQSQPESQAITDSSLNHKIPSR
ncbi:MAG TPA: hypothetical protein VHD35_00415 [Chitinophagaceae bacterium]|nr:hypothetical protein [Chitinophagaceae bacterium]